MEGIYAIKYVDHVRLIANCMVVLEKKNKDKMMNGYTYSTTRDGKADKLKKNKTLSYLHI